MKYILRGTVGLICIILVLNSVALVLRGVKLTYEAYHQAIVHPDMDRPFLPALEAMDLFFMALAFFIVAIGLAQLFIGDLPMMKDLSFAWLRIESFGSLKLLLWDTFLVTLFMLFITRLVSAQSLSWDLLVLPGAILMLTISSYLLKLRH